MTDTQLATLTRAVDEADSATALLDAVRDLAEANLPNAIPVLVDVLSYNNPGAAVAAVDGLIALGDAAVQPLLDQIGQQNYTARSWAVRALAGIGHPSGLEPLLNTLETDFAMSVRRAAACGLGNIRWSQLPAAERTVGQAKALDALLEAAEDGEWIVRYAVVKGMQCLAIAISDPNSDLFNTLQNTCKQLAEHDDSPAVRIRSCHALNVMQQSHDNQEVNWSAALERLYHRKAEERPVPEGDPRKFRTVAATLVPGQSQQ
jgi:phycocyanobilin lyase beta subunit